MGLFLISYPLAKEKEIKRIRINRQIRVPQVKLISSTGDLIGVVSTQDALKKAEEEGLDLVEISPNLFPPICKILDWGKYKYDLSKKGGGKGQKTGEIKTIRLSSKIGEHDLEVKAKKARKFLEKGFKVKAQLMFKGREITHKDVGESVLRKFNSSIEDVTEIEQDIKFIGREISIIFKPNK